jgi:hypothetical protein
MEEIKSMSQYTWGTVLPCSPNTNQKLMKHARCDGKGPKTGRWKLDLKPCRTRGCDGGLYFQRISALAFLLQSPWPRLFEKDASLCCPMRFDIIHLCGVLSVMHSHFESMEQHAKAIYLLIPARKEPDQVSCYLATSAALSKFMARYKNFLALRRPSAKVESCLKTRFKIV